MKDCGRDEREDDDLEPMQRKTDVVAGVHCHQRITPRNDKPRAVHLHLDTRFTVQLEARLVRLAFFALYGFEADARRDARAGARTRTDGSARRARRALRFADADLTRLLRQTVDPPRHAVGVEVLIAEEELKEKRCYEQPSDEICRRKCILTETDRPVFLFGCVKSRDSVHVNWLAPGDREGAWTMPLRYPGGRGPAKPSNQGPGWWSDPRRPPRGKAPGAFYLWGSPGKWRNWQTRWI